MAGLLKLVLIVNVFLATVCGKDLEKCAKSANSDGKCLNLPTGCDKDCKAIATVEKKAGAEDVYVFTYERADIGDTGYLAVGISKDKEMGDDLAVACVKLADGIKLHTIRTNAGAVSAANLIPPDTPPLLVDAKGAQEEGNLKCSFEIKFPFKFPGLEEFKVKGTTHMLMSFGKAQAEAPFIQKHDDKVPADTPFIKGGDVMPPPTTVAPSKESESGGDRSVSFQLWTSGAFMWIGIGMFVIPFIFL